MTNRNESASESEKMHSAQSSTRSAAPDDEVQGPLVRQPRAAANLALILWNASMELQDAAALHDAAWMWEEARAIASRILASCPLDPPQPVVLT
jgi:hypothetical protein